jgi:hypothetical protein
MTMNRLHTQDGYALATAVILISIMLLVGLASLSFVDTETSSSNRVRAHESRLNLTEGVVAAEVFQMSRSWPSTAAKQYPDTCTQATAVAQCPQPAQLQAQFSGPDFKPGATKWAVQVRDDVAGPTAEYYSDATVLGNPRYDANGNGEMWVRAEGQLGTKKRTVVARIRVESRSLKPPAAPFVAGRFNTGNNGGSKIIVQTSNGASGVVRCDTGGDMSHENNCIDYEDGQIQPTNMVRSDPSAGPSFGPDAQEALKQMAKDNGTYYASCPANPSGAVVWVERGDCAYGGNTDVNATTKKGMFIVANGTVALSGNLDWWGVIYALNQQNCGGSSITGCLSYKGYDDNVVTVTGTPTVHGAMLVDGGGRLGLGNSGSAGNCAGCLPTLVYVPSAGDDDLMLPGTAGIVQNTWRELISG